MPRKKRIKRKKAVKKAIVAEKLNDINPNDPYAYDENDPYGTKLKR